MKFLELWERFSHISAPSGRETGLSCVIAEVLSPYCDSVKTDKAGNLIAKIIPSGAKKRIMISAPMDECGFMVKSIDSDGRLRVTLLGNYDTRVLSGRRVVLSGGAYGIASAKPIHALSGDERAKPTAADKIYIELGVSGKAEAETFTHLGDTGVFEPKFTTLCNDFFAGKALGGRALCVALCLLAEQMSEKKKAGKLYHEIDLVFTVKRQIGRSVFAAEAAAFTLRPDTAIVLDASPAADFDGAKEPAAGCICGKGVVIASADSRMIANRELYANAMALAVNGKIAHQCPGTAALVGGEAGAVQKSAGGARTLTLGVPTRNLHSGAEIVQKNDVIAVLSLLSSICEKEIL